MGRLFFVLIQNFFLVFAIIAKEPGWLNAPEKSCKKSELCAIGAGTGFLSASSDAHSAISKIFETKISSTFKQTLDSSSDYGPEITTEIEEATEGVLNGIEIKKRYEGKDTVYVLAVLNKRKAAKAFKSKIKDIDDEMKVLLKDDTSRSAIKLEKLFHKREILNRRYEFLKGEKIRSPVSFEKVFKKRKATMKKAVLGVAIREGEIKGINEIVTGSLVELGYKVVELEGEGSSLATHVVQGSYTTESLYLKVDGFEKYKFVLNVFAIDKKGVKTGNLQFSTVQVGRNLKQAAEKASIEVEGYIKDHLHELSIE